MFWYVALSLAVLAALFVAAPLLQAPQGVSSANSTDAEV